jgi:hypothetical protein
VRSEDRPRNDERSARSDDRPARQTSDRPRGDQAAPRGNRPFTDRGTERHAPSDPAVSRRQSDQPVSFGKLVEMIGNDAKATGRDDLRAGQRPAVNRQR